MRKNWLRGLLLGVSVAFLLSGGVALAQQLTFDVGCGSPTIDGRVGSAEWANAAKLTLWGGVWLVGAEEGAAPALSNGPAYEAGTAYFLHDDDNFYVGAVMQDPMGTEPDNPTYYDLWMTWAFEDEPAGTPSRWVDCLWDADSCAESDEGALMGAEDNMSDSSSQETYFVPWYADPLPDECEEGGQIVMNPPGVKFDAAPRGAEAHYEMRVSLNNSPMDNVGVGDCFDMRWIFVYFHAGLRNGTIIGVYPVEPVDEDNYTGECTVLCLDPCEVEEEFVPEPGTIALLGSGLAGLAGYASLRWRNKK